MNLQQTQRIGGEDRIQPGIAADLLVSDDQRRSSVRLDFARPRRTQSRMLSPEGAGRGQGQRQGAHRRRDLEPAVGAIGVEPTAVAAGGKVVAVVGLKAQAGAALRAGDAAGLHPLAVVGV